LFIQAQAQCSLNGPTSLSSGQTATYTATTQSGASYFWSTTGGLTIVGGSTGSSVTIRGNSNGRVCYTRFRAGAEPCSVCQTVSVVDPNCPTSLSIFSFVQECLGNLASIRMIAIPNPAPTSSLTYNWVVISGPGSIIGNPAGDDITFVAPANSISQVQLTATCNGSLVGRIVRTVRVGNCNGFPIDQPIVFPNPVDNLLKVQVKDPSPNRNYSIEIINKRGKMVISRALKGTGEQVDLSNLQKGVYFVRTKQNGKLLNTKRLVKQ